MSRAVLLFEQIPNWAHIFWFSYAAWVFMEFWILRRDARAAQGKKSDGGSRFVLMVLIPAGLIGAFALPHFWPQVHIALPEQATFYTGIGLIWAGIALRIWAVTTLGEFFRTAVFVHTEHKLVTAGPYRVLRHPSYTGALITMAGVGVAIGNWLSVLSAMGGMFIAIAWRVAVEEKALAATFGVDFDAYKRRTWAFIPFIW